MFCLKFSMFNVVWSISIWSSSGPSATARRSFPQIAPIYLFATLSHSNQPTFFRQANKPFLQGTATSLVTTTHKCLGTSWYFRISLHIFVSLWPFQSNLILFGPCWFLVIWRLQYWRKWVLVGGCWWTMLLGGCWRTQCLHMTPH